MLFRSEQHLQLAAGAPILTFGGAWSNHLVATAYAAKQADLKLSLRNHFKMIWKDVQSWLDENQVPGMESTFEYEYDDDTRV